MHVDKVFVIFDDKKPDAKIHIDQGEIVQIFNFAYGWHTVFRKDTSDNIYQFKKQLGHIYDIASDDFISMFKMLNPQGKSYPIVKEILDERVKKLKEELSNIEKVLN